MKLTSLVCSNCSAPVEVPGGTEYFVCNHCGASLRVESSASATYTVVLEAISERTEEMAKDIAELKRSDRLRKLDEWWEKKRKRYMLRDQSGRQYRPHPVHSWIAIIGTLIAAVSAMSLGPREGFFATLLIVIIGSAITVYLQTLRTNYKTAFAAYKRKRRKILEE